MENGIHTSPTNSGETLLAGHYSSARAEIVARLDARRQTILYYLTGTAAVMGFGLQQPELWPLFYFIPFFGLYAAISYTQDDLSIRVISVWLKTEYSVALNAFRMSNHIGYELPHWDGAVHEGSEIRVAASKLRYIACHLMFVIAAVGSLVLATIKGYPRIGMWPALAVGILCLLPIALTVYLVRQADLHRKSTGVFLPSEGS